jgi:Protein ChrB, N-terminal
LHYTLAAMQWVLLSYRLPREPSTPRITLWRRLRRFGAAQLLDGLVALPLDDRNRERFDWLAEEIREAGGEAAIWVAEPATRAQDRGLVERFRAASAADYGAVVEAAGVLVDADVTRRRQGLARLRRTMRTLASRDYFTPPERARAERAVEALAAGDEVPA